VDSTQPLSSRVASETDVIKPVPQTRELRQPYRFKLWHIPLYLLLIIGTVLSIIPLLWMMSTSLMTLGETIQRQLLPSTPQWGNYVEAWRGANFQRYFVNTLIITLVTVSGMLVTSILAGYAFARINFVGRNIIFTILLTTLMIPEAVTLIPNFLLIRGDIIPWGSWVNRLQALTVPFMASAFMIFLLRQFFIRIPGELWDAARIDGASHLRFLLRIVIPMSTAPILTVALLSFISSWNAFMWPLIVTTTDVWRPLMVGIFRFNSEAGPQTHLIAAASVIIIMPIILLYFFMQKQFTNAFASSGLKG
jgi:ABC-type glycerol-3-phosphate transport system permease component